MAAPARVSATRTVATRPQVDANAVRAAFLAGKKRAEIYASMPVGQRECAQRLLTRMASKWAREAEGMMAERTAGKISHHQAGRGQIRILPPLPHQPAGGQHARDGARRGGARAERSADMSEAKTETGWGWYASLDAEIYQPARNPHAMLC